MPDDTLPASSGALNASSSLRAAENWQRYEYARQRGHRTYCHQAQKCERMYLGGGEQWDPDVKAELEAAGRPAHEWNEIMPALNSAIGYQIHNRMDIGFFPRGGMADDELAKLHNKVAMQVADKNKLHWTETQVFSDGLIEQRGYFDIRMCFDDNIRGDIKIRDLDPLDVLPDPDARTYDPDDGWHDWTFTAWLTYDEIEQYYGKEARLAVEGFGTNDPAQGDGDDDVPRNRFGDNLTGAQFDAYYVEGLVKRARVIDRQYTKFQMSKVLVNLDTAEVKLAETLEPEELAKHLQTGEWIGTKRMMKRIYWLVTTRDTVLFDDASPYPWFTLVPYFAYFRRGKTRGMVDNAISQQEIINKTVSSAVHIVSSTANSGWTVEQNSLTNMTTDDLEDQGAETGLVIEYKAGSKPPAKIEPNQIPTGVDRMIERALIAVKESTVPDAMRGTPGQEVSGIAIQSKQFASQQQLAVVLDNLSRTRYLLGKKILWCVQNYKTDYEIFRITETDPTTLAQKTVPLEVNKAKPDGTFWNDLSVGDFDIVITEVPMQITFENSQFQQAIEMRKQGVRIPDQFVVKHSNLADKTDILEAMTAPAQPDPELESKIRLADAQARYAGANAVTKMVEGMFDATTAANLIAQNPAIAPLADQMLKSAGFVDADAPPIVGAPAPGTPAVDIASNTHPNAPPNANVGMRRGSEQPANQGG